MQKLGKDKLVNLIKKEKQHCSFRGLRSVTFNLADSDLNWMGPLKNFVLEKGAFYKHVDSPITHLALHIYSFY